MILGNCLIFLLIFSLVFPTCVMFCLSEIQFMMICRKIKPGLRSSKDFLKSRKSMVIWLNLLNESQLPVLLKDKWNCIKWSCRLRCVCLQWTEMYKYINIVVCITSSLLTANIPIIWIQPMLFVGTFYCCLIYIGHNVKKTIQVHQFNL